jgi:hypothetical protein
VTEWIQDYMLERYNLEEIWLPTVEALEASRSATNLLTPSKLDRGKRVRFGSKSLPRTVVHSGGDEDRSHEDGDSRSDESETSIQWETQPRSGVFTVDEQELHRVTSEAMLKHTRCNIFISSDFWKCERLLVIIQSSGAVRPGQWSRSLCITHSIHAGSIVDYLELAKESGMGVIILNPNYNQIKLRVLSLDQPVGTMNAQHAYDIPGHHGHIQHILSVYDSHISQCQAKEMFFVANGHGGDTLLQLLNHRLDGTPSTSSKNSLPHLKRDSSNVPGPNILNTRVRALAFINSAHSISYAKNERVKNFIEERSVHWLTSSLPLDTSVPEQSDNFGCTCVSSGHSKADFAPVCSVNSVFEFFLGRIAPNDPKPNWTPITISFSNPPQNMPLPQHQIDDNDSENGTAEHSPRLIEIHHDAISNSSTSSTASSHTHQHSDSSLPKRIRLIEMIEMGTQTESRVTNETTQNQSSIATTSILHYSIHPIHIRFCPFCHLSSWIQESKIRTLLSLALIATGVIAAKYFSVYRKSSRQVPSKS